MAAVTIFDDITLTQTSLAYRSLTIKFIPCKLNPFSTHTTLTKTFAPLKFQINFLVI